jgi:hypothetical protein
MITPAVQAYTEVLPQASNLWQGMLDALASSEVPPQIPSFPDPASSAVHTAMSEWPGIHEAMTSQRNEAAAHFVSANYNTSGAFADTDGGNAQTVHSVQGTMMA